MKKLEKKNIAFISYYFPPIKAIGSRRNFNIVRQYNRYFNELYIYTTSNRIIRKKTDVYAVEGWTTKIIPTFDYQTIRWFISRLKLSQSNSNRNKAKANLANNFWFTFLLGEGGLLYVLCCVLRLLLKLHKIDYVYSSYSPWADHLVASILKRIKPKLIWIADFRDLPLATLEGEKMDDWEDSFYCKLVERADYVTTISSGLAKNFNLLNARVEIVRNGIDIAPRKPIDTVDNSPYYDNRKFLISYTGRLYGDRRNPSVLMKAIRRLLDFLPDLGHEIRIVYAGPERDRWEEYIDDEDLSTVAISLDEISYERSLQLQRDSNINVLLTWSGPKLKGVLTGKFYEYLEARRQILLLINGEKDKEFEDIFAELHLDSVYYNDAESIDGVFSMLLEGIKIYREEGNSRLSQEGLDNFTWATVVKNFLNKEDRNA